MKDINILKSWHRAELNRYKELIKEQEARITELENKIKDSKKVCGEYALLLEAALKERKDYDVKPR